MTLYWPDFEFLQKAPPDLCKLLLAIHDSREFASQCWEALFEYQVARRTEQQSGTAAKTGRRLEEVVRKLRQARQLLRDCEERHGEAGIHPIHLEPLLDSLSGMIGDYADWESEHNQAPHTRKGNEALDTLAADLHDAFTHHGVTLRRLRGLIDRAIPYLAIPEAPPSESSIKLAVAHAKGQFSTEQDMLN